jgi:DNA-binding LytR/AlgR family response regulator
MKKITALLIDDEYLALKLLEDYLSKLPEIEIVDKVKSPLKAIEILNSRHIDLIFLDIQMPTISGTNLLKTLKHKPVTIFTTAYSEHAAQAFDLDAVDYLLKPFSFERFLQAVNKAKEQISVANMQVNSPVTVEMEVEKNFISVKSEGKFVKIDFDDILFIEGLKEYVKIVCKKGYFITLESLRNLEAKLPESRFIRVHKSYIASIQKIKALSGNMLEIENYEVPVSREKKEEITRIVFGGLFFGSKENNNN